MRGRPSRSSQLISIFCVLPQNFLTKQRKPLDFRRRYDTLMRMRDFGVELDHQTSPRYLHEAMEDLLEDEDNSDSGDGPEKLRELRETLMSLPDEALRQLPPYVKRDLRDLSEAGILQEEVKKRLNRLNR